MSQLKVNSIVPVGGLPSGSNGGIIQIRQGIKTDTASTQSTTLVDTGLECSITPTLNSSKILVLVTANISGDHVELRIGCGLFRDSTQIFLGDGSGSRIRESWQGTGTRDDHQNNVHLSFLDSPATTSAITYKLKFHQEGGNYNVFINRNPRDLNNATTGRTASSITLMEVTT